jgi:hypothetical protein
VHEDEAERAGGAGFLELGAQPLKLGVAPGEDTAPPRACARLDGGEGFRPSQRLLRSIDGRSKSRIIRLDPAPGKRFGALSPS